MNTDWHPRAAATALRWRTSQVLVMLAVVLSGLGSWFFVRAGDGDNSALVDLARTDAVREQVSTALEGAFSYRHDDPDPTRRAAAEAFAGPAAQEYERLFAPIRDQEHLVLRSQVAAAGVRSLAGSHAMLLVFLDQTATRGDASSSGGAQLSVTATETGGRWRITGMQAR
ncbi:hypothetical protein [Saccharopolyspora taberi]|uniref:Membrane protein n=1 Tax=Saccharopolyspora taberi TaxID=60895 RepID=A0ABN3VET8_9PSEU